MLEIMGNDAIKQKRVSLEIPNCQQTAAILRGTRRLFSVKYLFREATRIFYFLRTTKNFQMTVPFRYNIQSLH